MLREKFIQRISYIPDTVKRYVLWISSGFYNQNHKSRCLKIRSFYYVMTPFCHPEYSFYHPERCEVSVSNINS